MSKITTADCVAYIVGNIQPKSYVADWKRTRKVKQGKDIVRTFENRETGMVVNVVETPDGKLIGEIFGQQQVQPSANPTAYVALAKSDMGDGEVLILYVGDVGCWHSERRLSDWTPQGTYEELERLGIAGGELQEATVEFYKPHTPEEIKARLSISHFFGFNKDFEKFMSEGDSEESTIIPMDSIKGIQ